MPATAGPVPENIQTATRHEAQRDPIASHYHIIAQSVSASSG